MDKATFEAAYAARLGITVAWLHATGRYGVPADRDGPCDDTECEGWHMVRKSIWEDDVRWGHRNPEDLELLK